MRALPDDAELVSDLRAALPQAARHGYSAARHAAHCAVTATSTWPFATAPLDAMARYQLAGTLAQRWGCDVDLLDFPRLSPLMQVQVLQGRKLFDDHELDALARFAGNMLARYEN